MNRTVLGGVIALFLTVGMAAPAFAGDLFACSGPLGGPIYVVTHEGSPPDYFLVKRQLVREETGMVVKELGRVRIGKPIMSAGLFISTTDLGRGGYVHIYFSEGDISLIDVNVFDVPQINTAGLLEGYNCGYVLLR